MKKTFLPWKTVAAGYLWFMLFNSVQAQSFVIESLPEKRMFISGQYLRPDYGKGTDAAITTSTFSGSYNLTIGAPAFGGFNLVTTLPIILKASDGDVTANGIGNLFLGLQTRPDSIADAYGILSGGIFLPTTSGGRAVEFMGVLANFYAPQKALRDVMTLYGNFLYVLKQARGLYWGFEAGAQLLVPLKSGNNSRDVLTHYGLSAGYRFSDVAVGWEILGLANLTSSFDSFGERFDHSVVWGAQLIKFPFRPSVFYQVIISDQNSELTVDVLNGVWGLKLDWHID